MQKSRKLKRTTTAPRFTDTDSNVISHSLEVLHYISEKAVQHGKFEITRYDLLFNQIQNVSELLACMRDKFDNLDLRQEETPY